MARSSIVLGVACALAVLGVCSAIPMSKVLLSDYVAGGAMCLDGTPGAYYIHQPATPSNDWIVYFEGGGWCYNEAQCVGRAGTDLGSSKNYPAVFDPGYEGGAGILSNDTNQNPDFATVLEFVYIRYCDGASYSGNAAAPVPYQGYSLHFRGWSILNAVLDDLLTNRGVAGAAQLLLTGCSAGGLAVYLHCDHVSEVMAPYDIPVRCVSDAGFFVDLPSAGSPSGQEMVIREDYTYVYNMQNASAGVNQACIAGTPAANQWQCFMAQYTMNFLQTPLFVMNSGYDSWQTSNIWFPAGINGAPPPAEWAACADTWQCTAQQMVTVASYHTQTLAAMSVALDPTTHHGAFVDSCWVHCQTSYWNSAATIGGRTIAQAVGDWYFDRVDPAQSKSVMCPWPCQEAGSKC